MSKKRCCQCKKNKVLTDFYKHLETKDGRNSTCIDCSKENAKKSYLANRHNPQYRAMMASFEAKYREQSPDKHLARYKAGRMRKELLKSECEKCKSQEKLHMHHPDYAKPLEVVTLCITCHVKEHHV